MTAANAGYNSLVAKLSDDVVPYRWIAPLLAVAGAALVPWALVLAFRLPARHTSEHWDVAWVGFDIALACALAATAWGIARRAPWAPSAAIAAATLLLCDAWFDNVLARGSGERLEAALEAAFVEVPLAIFCVWLALHCEHVVAALLAALRRRPGRSSADARLR